MDIFENILYYVLDMSTEISNGKLFVPGEVAEDGEWLTWRRPPVTGPHNWVRCTSSVLQKFSRLNDSAGTVQFAKRYGVFGAKQLNDSAPRLPNEIRVDPSFGRWAVGISGGMEDREPFAIWSMLARQVLAILRISASLQGRSRSPLPAIGSDEDWAAVTGPGEPLTDVRDAQFWLMIAVNEWLNMGQVGLRLGLTELSRERTRWMVEIGYGSEQGGYNLFGQLAYQLFLSVAGSGTGKLYVCSACTFPYIRRKKAPHPGQDNYCEDCSEEAARRASLRWKAKNRKAKP
jgi:hypothetical protein